MCWDTPTTLSQEVCNFVLPFTCLYRASWLARGGLLGPSQAFSEYVHSPVYTCDHLDSQEYIGAFLSPIFLFKHFG